jgi:hypothetical protein
MHALNPFNVVLAASLLIGSGGCTGSLTTDDGPPGSGSAGEATGGRGTTNSEASSCVAGEKLPQRIRALSGAQYQNTVRAVFPSAAEISNPFSLSDRSAEFSTSANLRRFDFNAAQAIMTNAAAIGEAAAADVMARFSCLSARTPGCAAEFVAALGRELYRAPLSDAEKSKLVALFEGAQAQAGAEGAVKLVLRSMLTSPRFLFQRELGSGGGSGVTTLTPHEIAGALAYALTNAPPDAPLREAADAGTLGDPARIREHAQRLLATEQGLVGLQTFMSEFFRTRDFSKKEKDATLFPQYDAEARQSLLADFEDTTAALLRSPSPTLGALLTTRRFVVRPRTAQLFGWPEASSLPEQGAEIEVTEAGRSGILTHPVFLASFAHPAETNPVARGHFVASNLLCVTIPPPPMAVTFPERSDDGMPKTLRQVIEAQHSVQSCAGCHQLMDPLGYPFEIYDAVGKLRSTDNGLPVDSSGTINGTNEIDGPVADLAQMLSKISLSTRAHECFAERVYKYVAGVDESSHLECATSRFKQQFQKAQGNIPELVIAILESPEFLERSVLPQ